MTDRIQDCVDVAAMFELARSHLPGSVYDFMTSGSQAEVTLRRNSDAFEKLSLQPRIGIDVSHTDTSTSVLGRKSRSAAYCSSCWWHGHVSPTG